MCVYRRTLAGSCVCLLVFFSIFLLLPLICSLPLWFCPQVSLETAMWSLRLSMMPSCSWGAMAPQDERGRKKRTEKKMVEERWWASAQIVVSMFNGTCYKSLCWAASDTQRVLCVTMFKIKLKHLLIHKSSTYSEVLSSFEFTCMAVWWMSLYSFSFFFCNLNEISSLLMHLIVSARSSVLRRYRVGFNLATGTQNNATCALRVTQSSLDK